MTNWCSIDLPDRVRALNDAAKSVSIGRAFVATFSCSLGHQHVVRYGHDLGRDWVESQVRKATGGIVIGQKKPMRGESRCPVCGDHKISCVLHEEP